MLGPGPLEEKGRATMRVVARSDEELLKLEGNRLMGAVPHLVGSSVEFLGAGNILFCEEGVTLKNARISFKGSGGVVYLAASKHPIYAEIIVWDGSTFFLGSNSYINPGEPLHAVASERRTIFIGDDALVSFGVWMRTADPHLVYRVSDMTRVNQSKDVVVGDHVWLGQEALLLKGTVVGSGSIVAARAVCAGKRIPSNTSWAGNPARQVAEGVFFSKQSVHAFSPEQSEHFDTFRKDSYIYKPRRHAGEIADEIGRVSAERSPERRVELLRSGYHDCADKNRLAVMSEPAPPRRGLFRR